jgi:hypothetical protein
VIHYNIKTRRKLNCDERMATIIQFLGFNYNMTPYMTEYWEIQP